MCFWPLRTKCFFGHFFGHVFDIFRTLCRHSVFLGCPTICPLQAYFLCLSLRSRSWDPPEPPSPEKRIVTKKSNFRGSLQSGPKAAPKAILDSIRWHVCNEKCREKERTNSKQFQKTTRFAKQSVGIPVFYSILKDCFEKRSGTISFFTFSFYAFWVPNGTSAERS